MAGSILSPTRKRGFVPRLRVGLRAAEGLALRSPQGLLHDGRATGVVVVGVGGRASLALEAGEILAVLRRGHRRQRLKIAAQGLQGVTLVVDLKRRAISQPADQRQRWRP